MELAFAHESPLYHHHSHEESQHFISELFAILILSLLGLWVLKTLRHRRALRKTSL